MTTESNPTNVNTEFGPETAPPTTSASSVNGMRFAQVESVQNFIESNENKNTRVKTLDHQKLFESFLSMQNETRKIHEIPPSELDEHLSKFFLSVRQKNGHEYKPVTLRNMLGSFERYLNRHKYGYSVVQGFEFQKTRDVLKSKQRNLKKQGFGNKPKAADALTDDHIENLYQSGQ